LFRINFDRGNLILFLEIKKDLCKHIDSEVGTEETELIQIFEKFVEKFMKKILIQ